MRQPLSSLPQPSQDSPEDILGQFFYAFGQGAGSMRVQRSAIAALRARYAGPIQAAPGPWKAVSANVLGFVAQVGRLAALFATEAGRTAINREDFMRARRLVERNVHARADSLHVFIAGPHCSELPEERDGADSIDLPTTAEEVDRVPEVPESTVRVHQTAH